jgi:putative ABC transport system permease protein
MINLFIAREIRRFPFFFLLLSFTLMLGTLGLLSINVISDQVKNRLQANAKELMTSDLVVSARRDLFDSEKEDVRSIMSRYSHQSYRVVDIYSMVKHLQSSHTRLVEIRAVEDGFPFYGEIKLQTGRFAVDGLYISEDLAQLWSVQLHDELKVGENTFSVKGIITQDSSQGLRGFSLAPRIYLPLVEVEKSGLLRPGSTGSFAYHYLLPELALSDFQNLRKNLLKPLTDVAVKVTLPEESSEQTGRIIGNLTDFMSLAALIRMILSLVGVFYLYQSHLIARIKDFCLFNLMGLPKAKILQGMLLQFSFVFFAVFILQILMIVPGHKLLAPGLSVVLGMELSPTVNLQSIFSQLPFLYFLVLSILIPLMMGLLRTPMGQQLKSSKISMGSFRFFDFLPFVGLLWFFAVYLSHSFRTGSIFFGCLLLIFLVSTFFIKGLQLLLKKVTHQHTLLQPNIESGIAIRNITRSGHKLTLSFISICMGATLISLILQLDKLIQKEFTLTESKPGLFIFDIQEDQLADLETFAQKRQIDLHATTPMIRARLEKINNKPFSRVEDTDALRTREEEHEARFRNRGINLTYRKELGPAEKIVAGEPFPDEIDTFDRPAFISVEKRFAQRMKLQLGDRVTFDVQGVEVEGMVKNLREVKWTSFYPNFFINVEPGFIDEAPKTYLSVIPQGETELKRSFQREAVEKFPNISFIDVEELISKLAALFDRSRQAIEMISWLSLCVGLVILYGLCHDQVIRRYYDLALLKTLGFSESSLRKHLLLEFGVLFLLALMVGLFLGWLMAISIGREVFKFNWSIDWPSFIYPGVFISILCLGTILLASAKALRAKPRELLSDT